jgi:hypothetical protein
MNEVTVNIMLSDKPANYHETFVCDTSINNQFRYRGFTYNIPKTDVSHYDITFWSFGLKLAKFYEMHTFWGKFDVFGFKKRATYQINFLYNEGIANPVQFTSPKVDYALENFNIKNESVLNQRIVKIGHKLDNRQQTIPNWLLVVGAIVIGIVAIIVLINFISGNPPAPNQPIVTLTPNPPRP